MAPWIADRPYITARRSLQSFHRRRLAGLAVDRQQRIALAFFVRIDGGDASIFEQAIHLQRLAHLGDLLEDHARLAVLVVEQAPAILVVVDIDARDGGAALVEQITASVSLGRFDRRAGAGVEIDAIDAQLRRVVHRAEATPGDHAPEAGIAFDRREQSGQRRVAAIVPSVCSNSVIFPVSSESTPVRTTSTRGPEIMIGMEAGKRSRACMVPLM